MIGPSMSLLPGTKLGPYEIVSELGRGGMGVVYTAHDPRLDRHVAIKLLPPDLTRDAIAKQRFLQEAKAASALDHPNISPSTRSTRRMMASSTWSWPTTRGRRSRSGSAKGRWT